MGPGRKHVLPLAAVLLLASITMSCSALSSIKDICHCLAVLPDISDYRHDAKHVPLPSGTPLQITVNTILSWPTTPVLPPTQPRFGRELQLVQVAQAFLQNASVNPEDCDIHLEISAVADRKAPRVIIETPVDTEYCANRKQIQSHLAQTGFTLDETHGGDLPNPVLVSVLGLPFEDFEHPITGRGSPEVATLWEIHPAVVTFL
ncbi:MAG TPA: hypothetical protein VFI95_16760 [Terriglobales bacterium]|nr:hypothetical protein [Terriglobales bacterium]